MERRSFIEGKTAKDIAMRWFTIELLVAPDGSAYWLVIAEDVRGTRHVWHEDGDVPHLDLVRKYEASQRKRRDA